MEEHFWVAEVFWYRINLRLRGRRGVTWFSVEIVMSHSTGKFRTGTLLWFRIRYGNNLWIKGGVEYNNFSSNFFVSKYRNISWSSLLYFRGNLVWKVYMDKRWVSRTDVDFFCLPVTKGFVEELSWVSEYFR